MNSEMLFLEIGDIGDDIIYEADTCNPYAKPDNVVNISWRRWATIAAAACLVLVVTVFMRWGPTDVPQNEVIIDGTTYSTTLTALSLRGQGLTNEDIEPLRYMTNLLVLELIGNQITDGFVVSG